ncbi:hypothetical protein ACET3X_005747 [Alternaria dauci]|uniref:Uncharacterized protein n=1 Tax=Alternaria dauci TaxID=48095 RepID=A0ABR3UHN9_9PLEO
MVVTRLLAKGIRVAVLDIQQLPPSLQGHAGVQFFKCDVTDPSEVYSVAEKIKDGMGAPTILVNNAGILASHTILSTSDVYLQKIFQVNVLSNWYTVKAFLPDMIRNNKGHIVTVASTASFTGVGGMADYSATKSAILGFHESLNAELKLHYKSPNVLTTSIHLTYARTPLIIPIEKGLKKAGEAIIEPSDIADAAFERIMSCRGG